ncbi:MAG: DUF892 family protein [Natrialbaceae archaeon]|nr:DUF892 family protein [Natrialbaceae archaeon]
MTIDTLHDKFVFELEEMYYVENRLLEVLETMAADVSSDELQEGLESHWEQTKTQIDRLEEVFELIDEPVEERPSPAFDAMIDERETFFEEAADGDMHDIHDLGAALKTEHFETAGYEDLILLARKLDLDHGVRERLDENKYEEQTTKEELTAMAEDSPVREIFARLAG